MHTTSIVLPKSYIWSQDPAVDKDHPDYSDEKYIESHFDPKYRPIKPGFEPAPFSLGPLPQKVMIALVGRPVGDQIYQAVIYGLISVTNWHHNGKPVVVKRVKADRLLRVDEKWMDECGAFNDITLMTELGNAVLALSGISPLDASDSPSSPG